MNVQFRAEDGVMTVTIDRPDVRNAVDMETAAAGRLLSVFRLGRRLSVVVLAGSGGHFCAGFDLKALATDSPNRLSETGEGPMGPTRMMLSKPVIASIAKGDGRHGS